MNNEHGNRGMGQKESEEKKGLGPLLYLTVSRRFDLGTSSPFPAMFYMRTHGGV